MVRRRVLCDKKRFNVQLHSLYSLEIYFLSKIEKTSISGVLWKLRSAGLDSLLGGRAEILSDRIRGIYKSKQS